jgi:nitrous oxidase accessory protein NosD
MAVLLLTAGLVTLAGPAGAAGTVHYVAPPPALPSLDTGCDFPGFNTIQAAVAASAPGSTIIVCPGGYPEQVTVDRNLTLTGSSATIQAGTLTGDLNIVDITNGATVTMSDFTVAGPGSGGCNSIHTGIAVLGGATLHLSDTTVRNIRDTPLCGSQNGEGIRIGTPRGSSTPDVGHATLDNVVVTGYQKNGIVVAGTGSSAQVTNSTTVGAGKTTVIAQNGVEVIDGATATVDTNVIKGDFYTPRDVTACGLLIINAAGVQASGNTYINDEKNQCNFGKGGGTFQG